MRLTISHRSAFIRAALQDVPQVDYRAKLQAVLTKAVEAQLPKPVQALLKTHPEFLMRNNISMYSMNFWITGLRGPIYFSVSSGTLPGFPDEVSAEVTALYMANEKQKDALVDLDKKLRSVVNGCTTRKQLLTALPEFEKYLPALPDQATNLPAVANVLTDFVKAGWPKNQPKMPKELAA